MRDSRFMKRLLSAGFILASLPLMLSAAETQQPKPAPTTKSIPIKRKNDNKGIHFAPSIVYWGNVVFDGVSNLYFELPFDYYPLFVELERVDGSSGNWTTHFHDSSDCELHFDGEPGEYTVVFTTESNEVFVGVFSIE